VLSTSNGRSIQENMRNMLPEVIAESYYKVERVLASISMSYKLKRMNV
ncbi:hypothetical protein Tco_1261166, partial [Tanacetum coccineum]